MSAIEDRVIEKIRSRAEVGLKKYGVTLERTDLHVLDWINHAQEELLDGAAYLERLKDYESEARRLINAALDTGGLRTKLHEQLYRDMCRFVGKKPDEVK